MPKRVQFILFVLGVIVLALVAVNLPQAQALDPSFPTRTPTPGSGQEPPPPSATSADPNDPGDPGDPSSSPTPTDISDSNGTAIPTQTGTVQFPLAGQGTATATSLPLLGGTIRANPGGTGECSDTPYIRAMRKLVVYGGPGTDFGPVSTLEADEMRPIMGRANYAQWWQIQVKPGMLGWVADAEVTEYGNTALVPVVAPPAINGATPTRGPLWNPTPLPLLTCIPTPTPSATPTGTATSEPNAVEGAAPGSGDEGGGSQPEAATTDMVSAEIVATPVSQANTTAAQVEDVAAQGSGISSRGSEAGRAASPTSTTNLLLPLAGLALIAGGIILALLSRNHGNSSGGKG